MIEKENGRSSSQQNLCLNGHDNLQKSSTSSAPSLVTSSLHDLTNKASTEDNVSPRRARQKTSEEARKMSVDDRPIRSSYADSRPIRRQSADDQPIRRQLADDRLIREQQEDNRPIKSVSSSNAKQNSLEESSNSKLDSPSRKSVNADDRPIRPAYTSEKPKRSRTEHKLRESSHSKSSLKLQEKSQRSHGKTSDVVCSKCQVPTEHPNKSRAMLQDNVSAVLPVSTVSVCSGLLQLVTKRVKGKC